MTRVAWIGTGAMGSRMAQRLLDAGYPISVWNRTASRAETLVAAGERAERYAVQVSPWAVAGQCADVRVRVRVVVRCLAVNWLILRPMDEVVLRADLHAQVRAGVTMIRASG